MTTTLHHAPSSIPSDYGLIARYAAHTANSLTDPEREINENGSSEEGEPIEDIESSPNTVRPRAVRQKRRSSASSNYIPSPSTTMANTPPQPPKGISVTETTPLIPRIHENEESNIPGDEEEEHLIWKEAKVLARYTLPIFGTHLFEYSLVVASVISLGHLSTTALAASTLGSMSASVTGFSIIQGLATTLDAMLPGAWTSGDPKLVGLWSQRMTVVMAITLFPIFFIWFQAETILLFLRQEPEVARLAALYLRWVSFGLPAYAFNAISRRWYQSQGLFHVPTNVILIVAPINAFLNWLLVLGPEPFRLGFIGAPIAAALSMNLISVASVGYGIFFAPRTAWHPLSLRAFQNLGLLVRLGIAGVGQTASEWWSWELVGLAASLLGPVSLATQSVLLVSCSTTYQVPFALSVATSVRIGNLLGENNHVRAHAASQAAFILALVCAGFLSSLFIVFRNQWGYIFNDDIEVVTLVAQIIPLCGVFQVFDGLQCVSAGILRACGKQIAGAAINLSAYYIIGIPFGMYLGFTLHLGLEGLWIGLTVALVYAAFLAIWICIRTDWPAEAVRVAARLEADQKPRDEETN